MDQTERMATVTLAPLTLEGAQEILEGRRHEDWTAGYPTPGDLVVAGRIVEGAWTPASDTRPWGVWTILVDAVVVGGVGFHSDPDDGGWVEIGYGIAEEHRGQGITTTALRMLLDKAQDGGASGAFATTDPDNVASQRVLQHCGFVRDGEVGEELRWSLALLPESTS